MPDIMSWNPSDPAITIDQMVEHNKLITLDEVRTELSVTEPLAYIDFSTGDGDETDIRWEISPDWNQEIGIKSGTDLIDGWVTLHAGSQGSHRYQLTLDGLRGAAKQCGLGVGYAERLPGELIQDQLDYWFRTGLGAKDLQLMVQGESQHVAALTRNSVLPFSNLTMLDKIIETIESRFPNTPIWVDRNKFSHSQRQTHLQLVLPEVSRLITGSGEVDDRWWGGVQLTNSLTAESLTEVNAFMFRQRCTNGYIDVQGTSPTWSRRSGGQDMDSVLTWLGQSVDEALAAYDGIFDKVQSLTEMRLDPNTVQQTANGVFEQYNIPQAARRRIIENLIENDQMTMYALNNAVTQAANGDVPAAQQQRLMRTGGDVIVHAERCVGCHRILPEGVDAHHVH